LTYTQAQLHSALEFVDGVDGHDGMMMLLLWRSVLVEMGMKVVVWYWWFEGVVVDGCDALFREREEMETENGEWGVSGLFAS